MCGIFCCLNSNSGEIQCMKNEWEICKDYILARGPDAFSERSEQLSTYWYSHFVGSVLWMQGTSLFPQPSVDEDGNILLWNGDIFSGKLSSEDKCDSETILHSLKTSTDIIATLYKIEGPYSFVYYKKSNNLLYFGRDKIGRHSLLFKIDHFNKSVIITSVAAKQIENIIELPAIGVFLMELKSEEMKFTCYPWKRLDANFNKTFDEFKDYFKVNIEIKILELFSEEISHSFIPESLSIMYSKILAESKNFERIMDQLLIEEDVRQRVEKLLYLLHKSVEVRIRKKPDFCKNCIRLSSLDEMVSCSHAKVGVPFSGGIDSTILAAIADKYVSRNESIDLINVAFEKAQSLDYNVPDRITGRKTYMELLQICPERRWNFVEVNITRKELETWRSSRIANLVYPLNTILDESLGCAVWFASRAKGILFPENVHYVSPCRILLFGIGADELFGGYMRHRTTLKHKGWAGLTEELNREIIHISKRNLGRDDRVSADHGRQARFPYLDENVVEYTQNLKPWERCYPTEEMPCGLGDKLLLRLVARKLNLNHAANFPKRAFQFGSRIANGKENAKDTSNRL